MTVREGDERTGADVDEAIESLESTSADLEATQFAVETGAFGRATTSSREDAIALLTVSMKQLINANEQVRAGVTR